MTRERRQKFGENLDKLCDICASDAIEKIQKKNRPVSSDDKAEDIAFYMDQGSARRGSIRGSGMAFAEKKRRQEERKETEMKKVNRTSRITISSSETGSSIECNAYTVDHSDDEMKEDADEGRGV